MAGITPSYFLALGKFVSFPSLEKAMIKGIYYIFEGELVLESPFFVHPKTLNHPKFPLVYSQASGMQPLGKALKLTGPWLCVEWATIPILSGFPLNGSLYWHKGSLVFRWDI